jgi:hypothetical protein
MILTALHMIGDCNLEVTMVFLSVFAGYTLDYLSAQVQFEPSFETWSLKDLTE